MIQSLHRCWTLNDVRLTNLTPKANVKQWLSIFLLLNENFLL